jgi:uncharacterized membrane protein YqjE
MSDVAASGARRAGSAAGPDVSDPTKPLEPETSLGELLGRLTHDFGDLVSTQVELAKVELKEDIKDAGKGAGLLGGGAFAAYLSLLLLSFAAVQGLDEVMPLGIAFLVVGLLYAVAAAVLVLQGRNKLRTVDPVPQTKASIQEDVAWAKQQKS